VAVLCTVGEPAGPGGLATVFHIYRDSMNLREDTNYDDPSTIAQTVMVNQFASDDRAWAEALSQAYAYAIRRVRDELQGNK